MSPPSQGDVGCGQTVVALGAAVEAVARGSQAALMAPTQFLAQQHFAKFTAMLEALPESGRPSVCLLTSTTKRAKAVRMVRGSYTFNSP